ncbi:hypothetical protein B0H21DRAFT_824880 [Amylocystis lapponica]|nr:hypothetical protein B0H21DRAFT_824880 [Amylocystis lapponica]
MSTLSVPSPWFSQLNGMSRMADSIELTLDASVECYQATLPCSSLKGGRQINSRTSDVYLVTLDDSDTKIVCKVTSNRRETAQLRGEAIMYRNLKALQGLSIPQCFGYYSSGENGEGPMSCLVLKYCGETLDLSGKEFFVTPVVYKKQALEILEEIHRMNYEHNDFCARNIALDEQKKIRLIDFGHAGPHGGSHGCHELKDGKHIAIGIVQETRDGLCAELDWAAINIGAWMPRSFGVCMAFVEAKRYLDNPEKIIEDYGLDWIPRKEILEEIRIAGEKYKELERKFRSRSAYS